MVWNLHSAVLPETRMGFNGFLKVGPLGSCGTIARKTVPEIEVDHVAHLEIHSITALETKWKWTRATRTLFVKALIYSRTLLATFASFKKALAVGFISLIFWFKCTFVLQQMKMDVLMWAQGGQRLQKVILLVRATTTNTKLYPWTRFLRCRHPEIARRNVRNISKPIGTGAMLAFTGHWVWITLASFWLLWILCSATKRLLQNWKPSQGLTNAVSITSDWFVL